MAVGRNECLFAGSNAGGERATVIYIVIRPPSLSGVNPYVWLTDVIARIADSPRTHALNSLP